jgi:hypothetical protein
MTGGLQVEVPLIRKEGIVGDSLTDNRCSVWANGKWICPSELARKVHLWSDWKRWIWGRLYDAFCKTCPTFFAQWGVAGVTCATLGWQEDGHRGEFVPWETCVTARINWSRVGVTEFEGSQSCSPPV